MRIIREYLADKPEEDSRDEFYLNFLNQQLDILRIEAGDLREIVYDYLDKSECLICAKNYSSSNNHIYFFSI